jgi:hypothetical protein
MLLLFFYFGTVIQRYRYYKKITLENLYNRKHHVLKKKDFISCLDIVLLWSHSVNYVEIPFKVQKM